MSSPIVDAFKLALAPASAALSAIEEGKYYEILTSQRASGIFHHETLLKSQTESWRNDIIHLLEAVTENEDDGNADSTGKLELAVIAMASLDLFLQANVTGPPLAWNPTESCLPKQLHGTGSIEKLYHYLASSLSVDGEAVYGRIPHIELFTIAQVIANHPSIVTDHVAFRWTRLRANSWHQRLLSEPSPTLKAKIREDLDYLGLQLLASTSSWSAEARAQFLVERASLHLLHGEDTKARADLHDAAKLSSFKYVLTGRMGKRTKFQTFDTSQLVVIARSGSDAVSQKNSDDTADLDIHSHPETFDLIDDTLLEKISFTKEDQIENPKVVGDIPSELQDIDPAQQPILNPLDSIILLTLASSVTNTSPDDGLTREETLPYAVRVLDGGSSNWQIYSQALLVRSRIETYRSRTVERGVLQMQALVDQVIAETTEKGKGKESESESGSSGDHSATTFLPRPKPSESAPAQERLKYIHLLASPTRWSFEAELAQKWISVGGLRTALGIYERLHMWAEAALCLAALEEDKKARDLVRKQLFEEGHTEQEKHPLPNDAPRLFCILGDLDNDLAMYERAWAVSHNRYARAQRSLGKVYLKARKFDQAEEAYSLSVAIHPQNSEAWFSLGCIRLELKQWKAAVEAFTRVVQREQDDAEAWSNLAAALMRLPADVDVPAQGVEDDEEASHIIATDPQKHVKQAFVAFKRAATLKRENFRIWQNVLSVAATISPPPYSDLIFAQTRIIEIRGPTEGESCVDVEILEGLLNHIIQISQEKRTMRVDGAVNGSGEKDEASPSRPRFGLERSFLELMNKKVIPLITHSRRLWLLVAKLNIYLNKPSAALDAYEKAWRVTLNRPGWDNESGLTGSSGTSTREENPVHEQNDDPTKVWRAVVDSTLELVDAYESLGEKEVTEGLKAGSGEVVCKNWRQKARMAIRSVTGRRKAAGLEDTEELQNRMDLLKNS